MASGGILGSFEPFITMKLYKIQLTVNIHKQPQDAYGLEKLATEELCKHYTKDFGIECRVGRFHNIYGPFGTWKGKALYCHLSQWGEKN